MIMRRSLLAAIGLFAFAHVASAQEAKAIGPNPACSAFGTTSGTCAQGGVITAAGPTGSATVAPIITYNAAGQLTTVTSATVTPAVGSITGLGTGVATLLGGTASGSGGPAGTTSPVLTTPSLGVATGTTLALSGCTISTRYLCAGPSGTTSSINTYWAIAGSSGASSSSGLVITENGTAASQFYHDVSSGKTVIATKGADPAINIADTTAIITWQGSTYANCTSLTTSSGAMGCTVSDRRVKNDQGTVGPLRALGMVLGMPKVHAFEFKDTYGPAGKHYGWFAQDVETFRPELVSRGPKTALTPDGELYFDKNELSALTAESVKAQQIEIMLLAALVIFLLIKRKK